MNTADVTESREKYEQLGVNCTGISIGEKAKEKKPEVVSSENGQLPFKLDAGKTGKVSPHQMFDDGKTMVRAFKKSDGSIEKDIIPQNIADEMRNFQKISKNKAPKKMIRKTQTQTRRTSGADVRE